MTSAFIESWDLFYLSYLNGFAIAAVLALAGIIVIARDQIFLGAAVSQAGALGVAAALLLHVLSGEDQYEVPFFDPLLLTVVLAFSVGAALLTARGGRSAGGESYEAVTGWVFLGASGFAVLIARFLVHGNEEVQKMLMSTLIGSTWAEVIIFASFLIFTILAFWRLYRPLLLFLLDEATFAAVGGRVRLWRPLTAISLGLLIGLTIRSSGMLYTFGCLVLPAMIAKNIFGRLGILFFAAPLIALVAALLGFMLANYFDFPPAQVIVVLLSFVFGLSWFIRTRH